MLNKKSSINILKNKLRLKSKTDSSLTKVAWSPFAMNPDHGNPISSASSSSSLSEPEVEKLEWTDAKRTQSNYTVKKHPDGFLYLVDQNGNVLTYEGSGFNFNDPQYKDQFQMAGYFNNMYGQPFGQDSVVEDLDNYNRETKTHGTVKVNAIPTGHMPVIIPHDVIQNAGLAEGMINPQALHDLLYYNGPARLRALDMKDNMPKVDTTSHMYTAFHPDDDSIVGTYRAHVDMAPVQRRVLNLIVQDAQLPEWSDKDSDTVRQSCINNGITDPNAILNAIEGEKQARESRREAARADLRAMDSYVPEGADPNNMPSLDERRLAIIDRHLRDNSNFSAFLQQVIGSAHNGSLDNSEFISTQRLAEHPHDRRKNYLSTNDFLAHTHLLADDRDLYRLRYAPDGDNAYNSAYWEQAIKNNENSWATNLTGKLSQWVISGAGHNYNKWFGDGTGQNWMIDLGDTAKKQLSPASMGQAMTGLTNFAISDFHEDSRQQMYSPTFDSILKNQYGYENVNEDLSKVNPWVLQMATYRAGIKAPSRFKYYASEGYNGMNAIGISDGMAEMLEGVSYIPIATAAAQGIKTAGRIAVPVISKTVNRMLASSAGKVGLQSVARNAASRLAASQAAGRRVPSLIDDLYRVSQGGTPSANLTALNIDTDTLIKGLVRFDNNQHQLVRGIDALGDGSQLHRVVLDSPTYDLFNLERVGLNSPNAGKWSALQIAGLPAGATPPYWSAAARAARMYGDDMMLNRMRNTGTILRDAWHAPSTLSGFKSMTGSFMPDFLANAVMPTGFINNYAPMIGRNINRLHNFNKLRRAESAMTMVGSPFWNNITEQAMLHSLSPTDGRSVDPYTGDILPNEQVMLPTGAGSSTVGLEGLVQTGRGILSSFAGYNPNTGKYDYIPNEWLSGPSDIYQLGLGPWLNDRYSIMQSQGNIGGYFTEESAPDKLLVRDYSINGGDSYRRISLDSEGYQTDAAFDREGYAYINTPENEIVLGSLHSPYSPGPYSEYNYTPYENRIFYNTNYGNVMPYQPFDQNQYINMDGGEDTSNIGGYIQPGRTFSIDSDTDTTNLSNPYYTPSANQPAINIYTGQEYQPGQPIYIENTGSDSITIDPSSTINTPLPSALPTSRVGNSATSTTSPTTKPKPIKVPKRRSSGGGFNVDSGEDTSQL